MFDRAQDGRRVEERFVELCRKGNFCPTDADFTTLDGRPKLIFVQACWQQEGGNNETTGLVDSMTRTAGDAADSADVDESALNDIDFCFSCVDNKVDHDRPVCETVTLKRSKI